MNALVRSVRRYGIALAALPILTCGDGGSSGPPEPAAIVVNGALPGSAPVSSALVPSVRVNDSNGGAIEGVAVTFEVTAGGGTITTTSASTDAAGAASPGTWTLGSSVGANTLVARHGSISTSITVNTTAVAASAIAPLTTNATQGTAGVAMPTPAGVRVTDEFGNPVGGAIVTFTPATGSGTVTGGPRTTGPDGIARPLSWTLGQVAGAQSLTAAVGALNTVVAVQAVAGPPAMLLRLSDSTQAGEPGLPVTELPSIRVQDKFGNNIGGATVTFAVAAGGGSVTGGTRVSDADGIATVGSWTLGADPAVNRVTAAVGVLSTRFTALAAGPSGLVAEKIAGDNTTCPINVDGCVFSIRVTQTNGQPAAGQAVVWSDGSGATVNTVTNTRGIATAGNIPPNSTTGARTQTAEVTLSGQQLTFGYELVTGGGYNIEIRYLGTPPSASIQAAFTQARQRWEQVITADLGSVLMDIDDPTDCGITVPPLNETIDDLVIYVSVQTIDGEGDILGRAGPCYVRVYAPGVVAPRFPVVSIMQLDTADLAELESEGGLYHVVLHEMGHTLGFPFLWFDQGTGLVQDTASTLNPYFRGTHGVAAHVVAGGTLVNGIGVPVEDLGGAGRRLSHWRESVHATELMTPLISTGAASNPLSAITIGSFLDVGYQVNFGAAETYTLPGAGVSAFRSHAADTLIELPMPMPRPVPQR